MGVCLELGRRAREAKVEKSSRPVLLLVLKREGATPLASWLREKSWLS